MLTWTGWLVGWEKFVSYAGWDMPSAWLPQPRNEPLLISRSLSRTTTGPILKTVEACRGMPSLEGSSPCRVSSSGRTPWLGVQVRYGVMAGAN
jgi:hypothetical protein